MVWRLPIVPRAFRLPSGPRSAVGVFLSANGFCMTYGNAEFSARRQLFSVSQMYFKNLAHCRHSVGVCNWYLRDNTPGLSFLRTPLHAPCSKAAGNTTSVPTEYIVHLPHSVRCFGTQRVVQKRRHQMRILHPLQTPYIHYEGGRRPPPIPHSLTASGTIKRLLNSNSIAAKEAASRINWEAYISHKKGVRWHPQGAWRVQFCRKNYERNFFVRCECYFKVSDYGFETAKELAVRYRERLEKEWEELQQQWNRLDIAEARARMHRKTGVELEAHAADEAEISNRNGVKDPSKE